ncbi:MAG: M48 family metallopeptidase [Alphaproteobacteria bacterium]|nr:M48 family metallopeptidase [Alphaproteobacteria bacterium]MBF0251088.1 M48 family metallopeptidase [Alphaproteobacteria bacterium]
MSAPFEPATFYDGLSARRRDVVVRFDADAVSILEGGDILARWPGAELILTGRDGTSVTLARAGNEARAVFTAPGAYGRVLAQLPDVRGRERRARRALWATVLASVATVAGVYAAMPWFASLVVALTPLDYERDLGTMAAADVAAFFAGPKGRASCHAEAGGAALDKLVARLSSDAAPRFPYVVEVLDTPRVNALALPGGRIFLFRGLVEKAGDESELAGVLAHEMAHVDARHPLQSLVRGMSLSVLADVLMGDAAMGNLSTVLMATSYSRASESHADEGAIAKLETAGIGAGGMARFFERLSDKERDAYFGLPDFLSTHPASEARAERARQAPQSGRAVLTDGEWRALQSICTSNPPLSAM